MMFSISIKNRWNQKRVESCHEKWSHTKNNTILRPNWEKTTTKMSKTNSIIQNHPKVIFQATKKPTKPPWFSNISPWKINMEHNHRGLVQIIFLSKWVICSLNVHLPGCFVVDFVWVALAFLHTRELHRSPSHPRIPARPWRSMDLQLHAGYLDTLGQRFSNGVFFPTKNVEIFAYIYCVYPIFTSSDHQKTMLFTVSGVRINPIHIWYVYTT